MVRVVVVMYFTNNLYILFTNIDNEVPDSCVQMDYFDEPALNENGKPPNDWCADCYNNKGGRLVYGRIMSHLGSCSAKIPCEVTSTEDTIIYEHVCA